MSNLIVITFDNEDEAGKVREALKSQSANINLDDSAVSCWVCWLVRWWARCLIWASTRSSSRT
jgi:hypothetical protein